MGQVLCNRKMLSWCRGTIFLLNDESILLRIRCGKDPKVEKEQGSLGGIWKSESSLANRLLGSLSYGVVFIAELVVQVIAPKGVLRGPLAPMTSISLHTQSHPK